MNLRATTDLAFDTAQLLLAAPQVIAARLARLALAGARPDARDRREFERMGREKLEAATEAWQAMGQHALAAAPAALYAAWQAAAVEWGRAFWGGRVWSLPALDGGPLGRLALDLAARGLAPVRRRALANARRLGAGG